MKRKNMIINKWDAQKILEGTEYIGMMYKYFGILPCEIKDDYRYIRIDDETLELQTKMDNLWFPVMKFCGVDTQKVWSGKRRRSLRQRIVKFLVG